ncbi:GOLPH3/VPS74 family protein [Marinifilum caeruleilacunae]|uniref:GPP34 family phosphoprotein n=1 Tax=Marinifilum caeruleilacunae TaxID=2499076 RepID=A0ABX1WT94_9BACT|nr:GPP34 family phosphoprotein [Marinifilum caeruleilacunae]NOU59138.1 GPP34 family phosphoprotein [Marinifilum caeruleilacunae]
MNLNLVDQLTLLALDDEKGSFVADSFSFAYGLAGAIILELSLQDRIEIVGKKIKVRSKESCNNALLDYFLDKMSNSKKERSIQTWVENIGEKVSYIKEETVDKLILEGILRREEKKILWIFSVDKFPAENAKPENLLRKRLNHILLNDKDVNMHEIMLISLIDMCELNNEVYGKQRAKEYKKKIKAIIEKGQLSSEIGKAVKEIHDALMAVIVVLITTTAVTTSISS